MSALRRGAVAIAVLLATLSIAVSAAAAPRWVEADQRFKAGVLHFKQMNYAAALVEFQRAYEIDPKYQVLYNIGETYYRLQDYPNALRTFQRYLSEGGNQIPPKRRKEVDGELAALSKRVATITITTSEPGALVAIDDIAVGTSPVAPQIVSAGRRKVTATLAGRAPVTQLVDVGGGEERALRLELVPLAAPPQPKPRRPEPSIVPTVITWSSTGALVTGAIVTGVLALGASADVEAELERFPGDPDALSSARDKAFGLGVATDVLIGTSIAVAALSVYFTVDFVLESDAAPAPARTVRVTAQPAGVAISGSF